MDTSFLDTVQNPTTVVTTADILTESSYLFYEMRDVKSSSIYKDPTLGDVPYEKYIHPLFSPDVINAHFNQELLDIIFEETPFYYLEPTLERSDKEATLSSTRDIGTRYVPTVLQTPFWEVWFREVQGFFQNTLLLDIFNKLRYPYVDECQYMNAKLFPNLAVKAFSSEEGKMSLKFRTDPKENTADIQKGDIGCLDYLDNVVNDKLDSNYSLINYKPDQADLLAAWSDSAYQSGKISYDELQREQTIYRLQDISYELLRRKFAGSYTLYKIALASVDRRGSFIRTVAIGDVYTGSTNKSFRDTRFARVLNIPGLLTKASKLDLTPYESLYEKPSKSNINSPLPLEVVTPLYYTSATQSFDGVGATEYEADAFYTGNSRLNMTVGAYRAQHLRDNVNVIEWNTPTSPHSSEAFNEIYNVLDTYTLKDGERVYRKLDQPLEIIKPDGTIDKETYPVNLLDIKTATISSSVTTGNALDINADMLLFHRNTLQQSLLDSYDYTTYSIANGNSISLMDTQWIKYLKSTTENKSRVQDVINFGTQISHYTKIAYPQTSEHTFFAVSYGDDTKIKTSPTGLVHEAITSIDELPIYSYDEWIHLTGKRPKYCYLWMYVISANIQTFEVREAPTLTSADVEPVLISKITLKFRDKITTGNATETVDDPQNPYNFNFSDFEDLQAFKELQNYHLGLLPFTYKKLKNLSIVNTRLGVYEKEGSLKFYDDITDLNYTKSAFVFVDSDMTNFSYAKEKPNKAGLVDGFASEYPSANTRAFYYLVRRFKEDPKTGALVDTYNWSEPINVINISSTFNFKKGGYTIKPDWRGLCYHLNPELNYILNSASPLRHKPTLKAPITKSPEGGYVIKEGASTTTALSNLLRTRHADFLSNDTGDDLSIWRNVENKETEKYLGFYLDRVYPDLANQKETPYEDIYGDNRFTDSVDLENDVLSARKRAAYKDDVFNKYCLRFTKHFSNKPATTVKQNNYFKLLPKKQALLKTSDWKNWWWNQKSTGLSLFFNTTISEIEIHAVFQKNMETQKAEWILNPTMPLKDIVCKEQYLLAQRKGEFKLHILLEESAVVIPQNASEYLDNFRIYPCKATVVFSYDTVDGTEQLQSYPFSVTLSSGKPVNTRIAANVITSENSTDIMLLINDVFYEKHLDKQYPPIKRHGSSYLKGIDLFTETISKTITVDDPDKGVVEQPIIDQQHMFKGDVFDFRLYTEGFSKENLLLLNRGLIREQYSNSPSIYRLGYNIYRDLGVHKIVSRIESRPGVEPDMLPNITGIRAFNRSVWDTRLVDMYPLSEEELSLNSPFYSLDVLDPRDDTDLFAKSSLGNYFPSDMIQQDLVNVVEVANNITPAMLQQNNQDANSNQKLFYNGKEETIYLDDKVTIVTTSLYPVVYNNMSFVSEGVLSLSEDGSYLYTVHDIDIPVTSVNKTLKYQADLNMNFLMNTTSNFSIWYSRGLNLARVYNDKLNKSVVKLTDATLRGTTNNYVLLPLTVPEQQELQQAETGFLDKFYVEGVELNQGFNVLLKATSYYSELRIPIAQASTLNGAITYASKWDALRALKEGAYYITNKYPMQILPFADEDYNISRKSNYATHYMTTRFKIVVKGEEVDYDSSKWSLKNHPAEYLRYNLPATLHSASSIEDPADNLSFPHRNLLIDLYVMDNTGIAGDLNSSISSYKWELLASNHVEAEGVVKLDKETLRNPITISAKIPMFFSKSFTAPFFVADSEENVINPAKVRDDLCRPISIKTVYNRDSLKAENINIISLSDLDQQVMVCGRSYKILFDLDAKLPEISFTDSSAAQSSAGYITEEEFSDYSRMYDISPQANSFTSNYLYTGIPTWQNTNRAEIDARTSGFETTKNGWKPIPNSELLTLDAPFYLGNPYSKSKESNHLLAISSQRQRINNMAFFPYLPTDLLENTFISGKYLSTISCIDRGQGNAGGETLKTDLEFNEFEALKTIHQTMQSYALAGFRALASSASGVFSQLSEITPRLYFRDAAGSSSKASKETFVRTLDRDLFAYHANSRNVSFRNGALKVSATTLFKNNLFLSQNFEDRSTWEVNVEGKYISDSSHDKLNGGKDVYEVDISKDNPFELKYLTSTAENKNNYEIALTVQNNPTVKVFAVLLKGGAPVEVSQGITELELKAKETAQYGLSTYNVFSAQTQSFVAADTVKFIIKTTSIETVSVRFTKAVARISQTIEHDLGLYDALSLTDPSKTSLTLLEHNIILFMKKSPVYDDVPEYLPVQFTNSVATRIINGTSQKVNFVDDTNVENFIEANSLGAVGSNSKLTRLLQPWVRRLQFWENYDTGSITIGRNEGSPKAVIRKYKVGTDPQGLPVKQVDSGVSKDIYSELDVAYDGVSNITIKKLKLNLADDKTFSSLANYNTNLKLCVDPESKRAPVSISNESFSAITNCFKPAQFGRGDAADVVVTNIQLLGKENDELGGKDEIIYEYEYLPIIYNEADQHISFNFMIHKGSV